MTSSNGNIFRVTGPVCGESPVPVNSPRKGQWRGALMFSLICARINDWVNNREAGDLRRNRGHCDVNVMYLLTHRRIYASVNWVNIGSDNVMSPGRREAFIWTSVGILLIWTLGINFNRILSKIHIFPFKKIHWKLSSAKWWPFCPGKMS